MTNDKSDAEIGARLKKMRINRGIRQNFVAEKLGVSNNFLSELEAGKKRWLAITVKRYETILGI